MQMIQLLFQHLGGKAFFSFQIVSLCLFRAQTMGMETCLGCNYEHHYFLHFIHLPNNRVFAVSADERIIVH